MLSYILLDKAFPRHATLMNDLNSISVFGISMSNLIQFDQTISFAFQMRGEIYVGISKTCSDIQIFVVQCTMVIVGTKT